MYINRIYLQAEIKQQEIIVHIIFQTLQELILLMVDQHLDLMFNLFGMIRLYKTKALKAD
jgi:hypothetical protein